MNSIISPINSDIDIPSLLKDNNNNDSEQHDSDNSPSLPLPLPSDSTDIRSNSSLPQSTSSSKNNSTNNSANGSVDNLLNPHPTLSDDESDLIQEQEYLFYIQFENSKETFLKKISDILYFFESNIQNNNKKYSLIIDGKSLSSISKSPLRSSFLPFLRSCYSLICYRASALQKKEVVEWIQSFDGNEVTLAIGDGANDVPMIQQSDIGIGIINRDGSSNEAVFASDIALSQFPFLSELLLVYGHWAYYQSSSLSLEAFFKIFLYLFLSFFFLIDSPLFPLELFDWWIIVGYSMMFSNVLPILLSLFDQDLSYHALLSFPYLYRETSRNHIYFNWKKLLMCIIQSFLIAGVAYVWGTRAYSVSTDDDGKENGFYVSTIVILTPVVFYLNIRPLLHLQNCTIIHILVSIGTIATYFVILFIYCSSSFSFSYSLTPSMNHIIHFLIWNPPFWVTTFAVVIIALIIQIVSLHITDNLQEKTETKVLQETLWTHKLQTAYVIQSNRPTPLSSPSL